MYRNEILQVTCDFYVLLEDQKLFLIRFKINCINQGISCKITKLYKNFIFTNITYRNYNFYKLWFLEPVVIAIRVSL